MKKFNAVLILILFLSAPVSVFAQDKNNNGPGISIGITGLFGTNTIDSSEPKDDFDPGYIIGGGITLQKRLAKYLAAGTGVEYRYFKVDLSMTEESTGLDYDVTWKFKGISAPFHLIATVKGPSSSLDLHAGITYTYIYSSEMSTGAVLPSGMTSDNAMRFTNSSQVAASGGVILRFMVTEQSDFFMGIMTEYYFTDLLKVNGDNDRLCLVNYYFSTGYMFRTDIF
jgi:hypothetical protein